MTSALQDFDRSTRRRPLSLTPYGLLLALALFVAGEVASSAHWHDAAKQLDTDCALCMLSTANGAAAVASAWQLPTVLIAAFIVILQSPTVRRTVVRFHDSRAPPSLS